MVYNLAQYQLYKFKSAPILLKLIKLLYKPDGETRSTENIICTENA